MKSPPKIVYLTAGAAGMYCGSCLRDNALADGLSRLGWDVTLLPLYTPIRVDEEDRSVDQVFFGGINVFLQQKIPLFRHLPAFLDRWLDHPALIRRVASRAVSVSAKELGSMTLSMVKGESGYQRKEVSRLVRWIQEVAQPDLICLSNLLVGGAIPALKRELGVPVLVTLQGDDVFLDELVEPWKSKVLTEMRRLAGEADGFVTFSDFYRGHMSELLEVPEEKFHLTPLGVTVSGFDAVREARQGRKPGQVIGYFARLAPEKGFDLAVGAFIELAAKYPEARFHAGGWLSEKDRAFYEEQIARLAAAGLQDRFRHVEAPDGEAKMEFLKEIDIFTVPTRFHEPKGLYLLEAMACGLPCVVPSRGAFPEMIEASGGGLLCEPEDPADLARRLGELLEDPAAATRLGEAGRAWVEAENDRARMAEATADVFARYLAV
ncbi:MAG: glycosyltransferase family 4 protein [Verrucomicrobiaceae bacterium]|nr:glycosyltransferase family 4 protein [Verrucomicrobiaceae bacterium]